VQITLGSKQALDQRCRRCEQHSNAKLDQGISQCASKVISYRLSSVLLVVPLNFERLKCGDIEHHPGTELSTCDLI
jgi:hypothetical protein